MITAIIICSTIIAVTVLFLKYTKEILLQALEAYKQVHTPPQPIIQQVPESLLNEIAEIKTKMSGVEMSRGIVRR
jgi:hypothetical protein